MCRIAIKHAFFKHPYNMSFQVKKKMLIKAAKLLRPFKQNQHF